MCNTTTHPLALFLRRVFLSPNPPAGRVYFSFGLEEDVREKKEKKKVVGSGSSDDEALQGNARLYTETCSVHCGISIASPATRECLWYAVKVHVRSDKIFWNAISISRPRNASISTCGSREIQKTTITKTSSVWRARGSGEARRGVDTRPPRGVACQIIHHGAQVGFHDAQGHRQQDQGQGPSEASLVLSDGTTDCSRGPLPPPSFLPPAAPKN